jgi:hypothetical protein
MKSSATGWISRQSTTVWAYAAGICWWSCDWLSQHELKFWMVVCWPESICSHSIWKGYLVSSMVVWSPQTTAYKSHTASLSYLLSRVMVFSMSTSWLVPSMWLHSVSLSVAFSTVWTLFLAPTVWACWIMQAFITLVKLWTWLLKGGLDLIFVLISVLHG